MNANTNFRRNFLKIAAGSMAALSMVAVTPPVFAQATPVSSAAKSVSANKYLCTVQDLQGTTIRRLVISDDQVYPLNDISGQPIGFQIVPVNNGTDYFRLNMWNTSQARNSQASLFDYQFSTSPSNILTYTSLNVRLVISQM